ncbi:hypothetical protein GQ457_14G021720 [Hibiscus cannabinus]
MPDNTLSQSSDSSESRVGKMFTNKRVNVVLDEMNFLLWKQQVLLTVRSHRLEKLLTGAMKPPAETVVVDGETLPNEEYETFVAQDSALASWLLSTISAHLLPQFVGVETAAAVWSTVLKFFVNRSTTSVMTLHCRLRSIKKGEESMRSYLTQVKEIFLVDAEAQLKGRLQFLVSANVAQVQSEGADRTQGVRHRTNQFNGGRTRFRGRGRARLQCQLFGKIGHSVGRCWHRFDQSFSGVLANSANDAKDGAGAAPMSGASKVCMDMRGQVAEPENRVASQERDVADEVADFGEQSFTQPSDRDETQGIGGQTHVIGSQSLINEGAGQSQQSQNDNILRSDSHSDARGCDQSEDRSETQEAGDVSHSDARGCDQDDGVQLLEEVNQVLTRWFSPNLKDQGMFDIPRKIHKISLKEVLSWTKRKKMEEAAVLVV